MATGKILDLKSLVTAYFSNGHYGIYRADLVCPEFCQFLIDNNLANVKFYQTQWGINDETLTDVVEISELT